MVSMSIAEATPFDNKVIDGIMVCGEGGGARMLRLAGTRLVLQQTNSQVGDHKLVLGRWSIWIHRVPRRQGSIDHLEIEDMHEKLLKSVFCFSEGFSQVMKWS